MRAARLASLLAVLALAGSAHASAGAAGPTGLHGFLLRADEPATTVFHRTPSFAWNPVPGAVRYEFQLSTTDTFRDNGILYRNAQLSTPVEAPPLTLPWITGSPHSLYARVRAVLAGTTTPWSAPYGFDVTPPAPPAPLPSYPGVLRWTPVEGADAYQVWFVDLPKSEVVRTNVIDLRELYTFHQSQQWTGTVRWRIRSIRGDVFNYRINGLPVAKYGAWSPVYSSTNPPLAAGPISLLGTVAGAFSDGGSGSPAHRTMPAFLWTGNQTESGAAAELYRVYVFTDGQCLNRVYTGAVTGSPAYAPRPYGPLALPTTAVALAAARSAYLADGSQPAQLTADGDSLVPTTTESAAPATATVTVPGDVPAATGTTPPPDSAGSGTDTPASPGSSASPGTSGIAVGGNLGAPVSLWDVDWPRAGYYWTVVPVAVTASATGAVTYTDLELPQDVCAAGRVQRFGISSEPSVTTAQAPFATGLSASGRLTSAAKTQAFYGRPLVAWTGAAGADLYQVQWSRTAYPFAAENDPRTGTKGQLTFSNAAVLPLQPGTWYYRVRGFDFNLPTGVQQMGWSQPQKLVVTAPRFQVVPPGTGTSFRVVGGSK